MLFSLIFSTCSLYFFCATLYFYSLFWRMSKRVQNKIARQLNNQECETLRDISSFYLCRQRKNTSYLFSRLLISEKVVINNEVMYTTIGSTNVVYYVVYFVFIAVYINFFIITIPRHVLS